MHSPRTMNTESSMPRLVSSMARAAPSGHPACGRHFPWPPGGYSNARGAFICQAMRSSSRFGDLDALPAFAAAVIAAAWRQAQACFRAWDGDPEHLQVVVVAAADHESGLRELHRLAQPVVAGAHRAAGADQ